MYISVRMGQTRVGGGLVFWAVAGPVLLASWLMAASCLLAARALWWLAGTAARSARDLTARQGPWSRGVQRPEAARASGRARHGRAENN